MLRICYLTRLIVAPVLFGVHTLLWSSATFLVGDSTTLSFGVGLQRSLPTPHAHLVVYHVDFHGATSHMGIHVGKLDHLNHDRNHVVIHVVFYNANQTS